MQRLLQLSKIIKHLSSVDVLFDMCSLTMKSFGIDYICYFVVYPAISGQDKPYLHVRGNFPEKWADYYFENNFFEIDPILKYARSARVPFHWFKLPELMKMTSQQSDYLKELYAAGFTDGISVPVYGAYGQTAILGFSSNNRMIELSEDDLDVLKHICISIHERYVQLTEDQFQNKISLSQREAEVLFWIAQGKSDASIATILNISENTVDTYMRRVYKKLNVQNRIMACVRAVCLGLIIPQEV